MDVATLIGFFLHIDKYLDSFITSYPVFVYVILFLIVFVETGVVVFPFLPGDSLLFAVGTFAALGSLNLLGVFVLLALAAIIGDSVNYWVGHKLHSHINNRNYRFLNREHLAMTEGFYHRHGSKTIILARFVPIVRTFAPFVAGLGQMHYSKFILYNILGGIAWVALFVFGGYFFGNIPIVKDNLSLVIIGIIIISLIPLAVQGIKHCLAKP